MTQLALRGGNPVRTAPFTAWPIYDEREARGLQEVLSSRNWGGYPCPNDLAREFAAKFAAHHGASYGVAVTNGTVSLELALLAAGIGYGDEVIVPAWSWISCFTAIVRLGALPVLAEIVEASSPALTINAVKAAPAFPHD